MYDIKERLPAKDAGPSLEEAVKLDPTKDEEDPDADIKGGTSIYLR